jgi:hypothetical protein
MAVDDRRGFGKRQRTSAPQAGYEVRSTQPTAADNDDWGCGENQLNMDAQDGQDQIRAAPMIAGVSG